MDDMLLLITTRVLSSTTGVMTASWARSTRLLIALMGQEFQILANF